MAEIISIIRPAKAAKGLEKPGRKTVLAGGCFDVLHPGHVIFLEKARQAGDILIVLLESDAKIKCLKGVNRPVHTQTERARILSALKSVDYVVLLPFMESDISYDELVLQIKPDIIAVTQGEACLHQRRAARLTGAKLKFVTKIIGNYSTSRILDHK